MSETGSELLPFLVELGARDVSHSGRSLYEHLRGTQEVLSAWSQPTDTCTAGLLHSIYGTASFRRLLVTDRSSLQRRLPESVERLVFTFSRLDRDRFVRWRATADPHSRYQQDELTIGLPDSIALAHVLVANLFEAACYGALPELPRARLMSRCSMITRKLRRYLSGGAVSDVFSRH